MLAGEEKFSHMGGQKVFFCPFIVYPEKPIKTLNKGNWLLVKSVRKMFLVWFISQQNE